ncbi:hypothetical protein BC827DRAFT_1266911 [Russula dissimulans]|nr:hypothetical protein BC827DRAFT_1266911 [Russula dissimulans]
MTSIDLDVPEYKSVSRQSGFPAFAHYPSFAALATVLVALASQTLAASWGNSRRAWESAVAAREPPRFVVMSVSRDKWYKQQKLTNADTFSPEQFSQLFPMNGEERVILPRRLSYGSLLPEFQIQVANNFEHGTIALRRAFGRNEARARQKLAMREYERDLLTSLLKAREFDELD